MRSRERASTLAWEADPLLGPGGDERVERSEDVGSAPADAPACSSACGPGSCPLPLRVRAATEEGYRQLLAWSRGFGLLQRAGVE
ncbi:hypothetical protein [Streptomyces tailanensis]|uniref:hypothetical protein n=1 Tax=Streptomyces tailanensis TaxID=2569858 RepID=UPI00122E6659|nr:hypothetical protein [Streptomyces tailanensis]